MAETGLPDLGKKVGPLPVGAWIAVVVGGLGIAWYINRNSGGGGSIFGGGQGSESVALPDSDVGTGGGQFISSPPTTVDNTPQSYETNDQWARAAILHLLSEGKDPVKATSAVNKYIAELAVTAEEQAMIGLAIQALGPPPTLPTNPPAPPVVEPPDTTTPPVAVALTPPSGVKATAIGTTSVTLEWNKVPGAHSYRVYRKGLGVNIGGSMDTKIRVGGLKRNTTYYFHVRALDAKGKLGPASASKTVKTKK